MPGECSYISRGEPILLGLVPPGALFGAHGASSPEEEEDDAGLSFQCEKDLWLSVYASCFSVYIM